MLRHCAVCGCNPSIFETNIKDQWFSFEKNLYSQRLKDGSLREVTQRLEQSLLLGVQESNADSFFNSWENIDYEKIKQMFQHNIKDIVRYDTGEEHEVYVELDFQKLNLRQFKYLTDAERIDSEFKLHLEEEKTYSSLVVLNTKLCRNDSNGPTLRAEKIEAGDTVYTKVVDKRDIGVYLSFLLGAKEGDELKPLSANVEDVKDTDIGVEIIVRFGPGIVGRAIEDPRKKVGIIRTPVSRPYFLWYLAVAIGILVLYYLIYMGK
ncbi:MAG: hypothetical protein ACOC5T_00290 [Elusimicrobiota bacterium]